MLPLFYNLKPKNHKIDKNHPTYIYRFAYHINNKINKEIIEMFKKENENMRDAEEELETYVIPNKKTSSLDVQVGGNHYKCFKIQPIQYNIENEIGFAEGNIIKYVSRWKYKNGIQDLKKALHCLEVLIELEECKEQDK